VPCYISENTVIPHTYQVFCGISICIICNNDKGYRISSREVHCLIYIIWHSLQFFNDQTHDSCLLVLNIHSSSLCFHYLNHNHDTKYNSMRHSVPTPYTDPTKRAECHTLACTQTCNVGVEYVFIAYSITIILCREIYTIFATSVDCKKTKHRK
jgi:hypothetical protein